MITRNNPGQDFGKDSPGHDRIQKAWKHFLEYLTQPENIYMKPHQAKQNPTQLFLLLDLRQEQISDK